MLNGITMFCGMPTKFILRLLIFMLTVDDVNCHEMTTGAPMFIQINNNNNNHYAFIQSEAKNYKHIFYTVIIRFIL